MGAGGRELKREFLRDLGELPLNELFISSDTRPAQTLIHALFSCLCNSDEKTRWFSVSLFGRVMARLADEDMEKARVVMRRFMWMLNDESGGIGWGVPEAFAECLATHPGLAAEYSHILVSFMREDGFYLELEMLQRGLMWGVGRAAQDRAPLLYKNNVLSHLLPYLHSPDAAVRGLACWAFGNLKAREHESDVVSLLADQHPVRLYEHGVFRTASVGDLAQEALSTMKAEAA